MMRSILKIVLLCVCTVVTYAQKTNSGLPVKLKFLTYNVGHFNQGKLGGFQGEGEIATAQMKAWRKWIGDMGADIMIVNEWNEKFDKDGKIDATEELLKPYYNNIYFGVKNEWIFNGIATNYKLENIRQVDWFGQYYAVVGDIMINNKPVTILSTHILWQVEWHEKAVDKLIAELSKYERFICLGDFNAKNSTFERLKLLGYNVASGGAQGWFTTAPGGKMNGKIDVNIDNIVTSRNIKIMKVEAPNTGLNDLDHLPVLAEIIISE
ncbi:endonuclease/exonuclease/phosphatase family protein [Myroides odoratimimus]|uniref:endonuclease/exonuclease/phosphatase family protein n=1 Tax=Myroides odoratimimus TaxID=76832 RepID=UPI002578102D|nr:endonuclease/exonuclease/phosphatase family protein [Myroides odoratimimus]